jgi:hypothetical protein
MPASGHSYWFAGAEPCSAPAFEESERFMLWPVLALIGFLAVVAFVIALGTGSTGRYERERRALSAAPKTRELSGIRVLPRPVVAHVTVPITLPGPVSSLGKRALTDPSSLEERRREKQDRTAARGRHRASGD